MRISRDRAAAELVVRCLARGAPRGPALVMEDPLPTVAHALGDHGVPVESWSRRAYPGTEPTTWPADRPYRFAALRLPRSKEELTMAAHAAASVVVPGGRLWIYGVNDEGVRSAAGRVEPLWGPLSTLATGGHARLLEAVRPERLAGLRRGLDAWRTTSELDVPWGRVGWVSYPGVFSHGRLDPGTALLVDHLPALRRGARVLDYASGTGFVAAALRDAYPEARLTLLEWDAVAAAAAAINVPGASIALGRGWPALGGESREPFDAVVANPPYHEGKAQTLARIGELASGAAAHLVKGGTLRIVVQRRLPVRPLLEDALGRTGVIADAGPYRVWESLRAAGRRPVVGG